MEFPGVFGPEDTRDGKPFQKSYPSGFFLTTSNQGDLLAMCYGGSHLWKKALAEPSKADEAVLSSRRFVHVIGNHMTRLQVCPSVACRGIGLLFRKNGRRGP